MTSTPWLLLVEDDDDAREGLAALLRRRGYVVRTAENGAEALDRLNRGGPLPSLILLDLMMPVMNGWEFRQAQLGDPRLCRIPVLVLTGGTPRDPGGALQAFQYLKKPIDPDELVAVIATAPMQTRPQPMSARA
jgi:CheY-like chemotaxis protein